MKKAYLGGEDRASHSYNDIVNKKNKSMYLKGGNIYMYLSFKGKSPCFNITTDKEGVGSAVLIRGIEPIHGVEFMKSKSLKKDPNIHTLCSIAIFI
jgi:DNA-3-methyladenine glycosylase